MMLESVFARQAVVAQVVQAQVWVSASVLSMIELRMLPALFWVSPLVAAKPALLWAPLLGAVQALL